MARRLTPTNAGARPDRTIGPDEALPTEPNVPDPGPPAERTATPVARLLPDRWTAVAYARGQLAAVVTGNDIRPELPVGPNLDETKPSKDLVVERVTNGKPPMPSFKGQLTGEEIQAVAEYVSTVAGK